MVRLTKEQIEEYGALLDDPSEPGTIRIQKEMPKILDKLVKRLTEAQLEFERDFYRFTGRQSDWKVQVHHPDFGTKVMAPAFDPETDGAGAKGNRQQRRAAKSAARHEKANGNPWRRFSISFHPDLEIDEDLRYRVRKMIDIMYEQRSKWDLSEKPGMGGYLELPDEGRILHLFVDTAQRSVHVALMPEDFELPEGTAPTPFDTRH
jgi:hypothetical protein